jgi:hypothetical protein
MEQYHPALKAPRLPKMAGQITAQEPQSEIV